MLLGACGASPQSQQTLAVQQQGCAAGNPDACVAASNQAQANQAEAMLSTASATQTITAHAIIFNARLDAAICGILLVMVAAILIDSLRIWSGILRGTREAQVRETPFVPTQLRPEEL